VHVLRQATDVNTTRRKYFSYWITKATDTHSEFVILIAFPRKNLLGETASMLRNTDPACLDFSKICFFLIFIVAPCILKFTDYYTPTNALLYKSKVYIKTLKSSYMFRSLDHTKGAYIVPC
jgi:hypothetical protein